MKKMIVMAVVIMALTANFAAAEEAAPQPVAEQSVIETDSLATDEPVVEQPVLEADTPDAVKRPPIREYFNAENTAEFGDLFTRAVEYEGAYSEQGKNLTPWIVTIDVLNEKNIFGWRKGPWKAAPSMASIVAAPLTGWLTFNAVANTKTPEGWVMTMVPRDKELAGFKRITITADQQDIVNAEIK